MSGPSMRPGSVELDVDDFGDTVDPVPHDAFDAGLQRLGRRRAGAARPDEGDADDTGRLVDVTEDDVAAVGVQRRADGFDGFLDLLTHAGSIEAAGAVRFLLMALFAHQGGWDEILLVLAPIAVIAGLVRLVQHRAERAERLDRAAPAEPVGSGPADQSR